MSAENTSTREINWRGVVGITAAALLLYGGFRVLPTGTNLHHMDFQMSGANALEMCDPSNPQFIPVVAMRSPVRMELRPADGGTDTEASEAGGARRFVLTLATTGGRPIGPVDLLTVHTRKLHLLVIDPSLRDYQHLHPEPGARPGEWTFAHTPRLAGKYRVFADFTPRVTGRGLYAFADYVAESHALADADGVATDWAKPEASLGEEAEVGPWRFRLGTRNGVPVKAGVPTTLVFDGREILGGEVPLVLVMDAYAHLVAFDADLSGFAHLHPRGEAPEDYAVAVPDARRPTLFFDLTIPTAGRYVVWAQVNLAGGERFIPFVIKVQP